MVCVAPAYQSLHENASCLGCEVTSWEIEADKTGRLRFSVSHSLCNCHRASSVLNTTGCVHIDIAHVLMERTIEAYVLKRAISDKCVDIVIAG